MAVCIPYSSQSAIRIAFQKIQTFIWLGFLIDAFSAGNNGVLFCNIQGGIIKARMTVVRGTKKWAVGNIHCILH